VQHKVFRVERMLGVRAAARPMGIVAEDKIAAPKAPQPDAADTTVQSLKRELALLHDAIAHNMRELTTLIGEGRERHMAHAAGKLGAAVEGMEKATEKILKSTEVIDDSAKALAASLKDDYKRGLAQEIQDHETLNMIEDQVEAMLDRHKGRPGEAPAAKPVSDHGLLNGPRLDGDSGHTNQIDIDKMFA
jgi:chemotaxis protein CheZ